MTIPAALMGRRLVAACLVPVVLAGVGCTLPAKAKETVTQPAPPLLEGRAGRGDGAPTDGVAADLDPAGAAKEAARAAGEAATPEVDAEPVPEPSKARLQAEAARVLDDWHRAASVGDERRFLDHFALDAVFMGPDPDERWDLATFSSYVRDAFAQQQNWSNQSVDRHMLFGPSMDVAWFDEKLDSGGFTGVRGTGVLRREDDTWKIVHYSMTYTIPNSIAREVVRTVKSVSDLR